VRRAARKDGPHAEIIAALGAVGATVAILEPRPESPGLPDLLVGYRGLNVLLEVKAPRGELSVEQESFAACWRGEKPWTVTCVHQALVAIGAAEPPSKQARRERWRKVELAPKGPRLVSSVRR